MVNNCIFSRLLLEIAESIVPWVVSKDPTDFAGMVRELDNQAKGVGLREGWVPDSTYWLVGEESGKVLGAVNIRHELTEFLWNAGGHIGYGIRPSERRKGYATKLLALALERAREFGIGRALVVCDEGNVASAKTIINNGGKPDVDHVEKDGNVIKRFWIEL